MSQLNVPVSGIEGEVILRPLSPIERPGMSNFRPFKATVTVRDQKGHAVGRFQSGANGRFRVNLQPGTYVLCPESPQSFPRSRQETVIVEQNKFTYVCITYDTGIR